MGRRLFRDAVLEVSESDGPPQDPLLLLAQRLLGHRREMDAKQLHHRAQFLLKRIVHSVVDTTLDLKRIDCVIAAEADHLPTKVVREVDEVPEWVENQHLDLGIHHQPMVHLVFLGERLSGAHCAGDCLRVRGELVSVEDNRRVRRVKPIEDPLGVGNHRLNKRKHRADGGLLHQLSRLDRIVTERAECVL